MKKLVPAVVLLLMAACPPSSPAFLDYLFSGSGSRDAIDNSAVGDLRAWWTGNPAYQFNPWYTPSQPGAAPGAGQQQQQQPMQQGSYTVNAPQTGGSFYPPQQPMYEGYGQQGAQPQAMPQSYQTPQAMPQPVYQQVPQQYQGAPQQYQPMPQYQTQAAPQYQQQQYPAAQGQYQYPPQQYQGAPQGYQPMGQQ